MADNKPLYLFNNVGRGLVRKTLNIYSNYVSLVEPEFLPNKSKETIISFNEITSVKSDRNLVDFFLTSTVTIADKEKTIRLVLRNSDAVKVVNYLKEGRMNILKRG